jgi:hypothetical protein
LRLCLLFFLPGSFPPFSKMPKTYEYDHILFKQFQERADMQADPDITISKYKIFLSQAGRIRTAPF